LHAHSPIAVGAVQVRVGVGVVGQTCEDTQSHTLATRDACVPRELRSRHVRKLTFAPLVCVRMFTCVCMCVCVCVICQTRLKSVVETTSWPTRTWCRSSSAWDEARTPVPSSTPHSCRLRGIRFTAFPSECVLPPRCSCPSSSALHARTLRAPHVEAPCQHDFPC
jgi:hypothetical protein